jgi:hypothetical protein
MDLQTIRTVLVIAVPFLLATLWAIIHASQKEFGSLREKVLWMMIAAIPFIGFIIYLIFGFRKGKNMGESHE